MISVYYIKNEVNNKFYVGSTSNIKTRINRHFAELKRGAHHSKDMMEDFNRFGEDVFTYEEVCRCKDDDRDELEKFYIHKYNTLKPNGYNSTLMTGQYIQNVSVFVYNRDGAFVESFDKFNKATEKYGEIGSIYYKNKKKQSNFSVNRDGFVLLDRYVGDTASVESFMNVDLMCLKLSDLSISDLTIRTFETFLGLKYNEINTAYRYCYPKVLSEDVYFFISKNNIKEFISKHEESSPRDRYLCLFDAKGNFKKAYKSKFFAEADLGIKASLINSNSKSNNLGCFKKNMYKVRNENIFKHYKLTEIPKKINIITGETEILHDIVHKMYAMKQNS